ncbi:hypothetical protein RHMOL_Rhmol06G0167700 [Rhododendron molle]|uniref:Uncharacterized protein n=3 Tax=Rhododendron molle TaxID=49168 RepID=A0ACC0ND94_RHOML|nr:hypothetical protein RHMOL_Rhmol06G0167700 [Rhododendron molle]KAI8551217.1 hypothetical protein RHMOL_Rhmol06G0167700 [Rhododendron molle]KAI8551218.1 hypothetical protein RHMOL_Rhmol06G0167700 [Rhododendron molle]
MVASSGPSSTFPFVDTAKHVAQGKLQTNALVDGSWTLAFRDEDYCKSAIASHCEVQVLQERNTGVVIRDEQDIMRLRELS